MDSNQWLLVGGFAVVINAIILYVIINAATKATQRAKYEWAQMELLLKMARIQGVSEAELTKIVERVNKS